MEELGILILVGLVIWILSSIPAWVYITLAVLAGIVFLCYIFCAIKDAVYDHEPDDVKRKIRMGLWWTILAIGGVVLFLYCPWTMVVVSGLLLVLHVRKTRVEKSTRRSLSAVENKSI